MSTHCADCGDFYPLHSGFYLCWRCANRRSYRAEHPFGYCSSHGGGFGTEAAARAHAAACRRFYDELSPGGFQAKRYGIRVSLEGIALPPPEPPRPADVRPTVHPGPWGTIQRLPGKYFRRRVR